ELLQRLAAGHRRLVTVEENALPGGFGSAVLEALGSTVEIVRFGLPDAFVPHGERARVLADLGLTPQAVALAALAHSPALTRVK
ncbi:MAG: transketolase C-terminal domain-containing protein, partial [Deltaproteobacteria bacterium]